MYQQTAILQPTGNEKLHSDLYTMLPMKTCAKLHYQ